MTPRNNVTATRGKSGEQSFVNTWEHAKPLKKWMEVSAACEVLNTLLNEKKNTWTKCGRESAKRETELFAMLEQAAPDEKEGEKDREKLDDKLEVSLTKKE